MDANRALSQLSYGPVWNGYRDIIAIFFPSVKSFLKNVCKKCVLGIDKRLKI